MKSGIMYTDGACLGNPGPAGAGFVITTPEGGLLREGSVVIGHGTNNIAEYQGLLSGLEAAQELGLTHLEVRSDSELLCRQMTGRYKVRNPGLQKLYARARELVRGFERVDFQHVYREHNERADALASEAARRANRHSP